MNFLKNPVLFVTFYILFMLPTYILPYFGSNSSVLNAVASVEIHHLNPLFYVHFLCLLILVMVAWFRGVRIDKRWIVIFPVLALLFDLTPVLSAIPLIPTVMHILTIVLGVIVTTKSIETVGRIPS